MEQNTMQTKPLLRANEFAKYIGISVSSLDRNQADGLIPPADFLIGKGRIRLWKIETINAWLENQCRNPKTVAA